MNLTNAGPLIALINKNDPNHVACVTAAKHLPVSPLITTWPCFTEAMYLLFRVNGYAAQAELWRWRTSRRLVLHDLNEDEISRMAVLMNKYQDRPMDLADASLVATAEQFGISRIFTLDSDFRIYRLANGSALECIPYLSR